MNYKSDFSGRLTLMILVSFIIGSSIIEFGVFSEGILLIWGAITISLVIALLTLINEITFDDNNEQYHRDTEEDSFKSKLFRRFKKLDFLHKNKFINKLNSKIVIGIPLRTLLSLIVLTLVAFSLILTDINMNGPSVLDYHKYIISKIADSDDPKMVLLEETTSNGGMPRVLLEDIQKIKNGETNMGFPFPWGIDVMVYSENETWTLRYWRCGNVWEFEGVKSKITSNLIVG
ncbi:hypothetical protein EHE19_006830 [Ruminiclostridium herbifermentans]|uniref:Uncharacterized protein n=2 Tax=Ruminiclostridium herbifermentans TaxID=2488810 RepID=A0A7H1VRX6_9FIRM|nr:hypothetical protein EHE19_006830 [Ruminiclostridium herbifermentans]